MGVYWLILFNDRPSVAYRFANLDDAKIRTEEAKEEVCRLCGKYCAALDQLMSLLSDEKSRTCASTTILFLSAGETRSTAK